MKEGWKVASVTILLFLIGTDVGLRAQIAADRIEGHPPQQRQDGGAASGGQKANSDSAQAPAISVVNPSGGTETRKAQQDTEKPKIPVIVAAPAEFLAGIKATDIGLCIFAGAAVFFAYLQLRVYRRMRYLMTVQTAASRRQVRIMDKQAALTERQFSLVGLQTEIMEKQKDILRQGHIATHRPRLSVRNVVIRAEYRRHPHQSDLILGEFLAGQLYVVNKGGYEAHIIGAMVMIYQTNEPNLPMERPYDGQNGNIGRWSAPLLAGQSHPIPFSLNEPISDDVRSRIIEGRDGKRLYVMGWIEYRDGGYDIRTDTQLTRRTAFCRLYDPTAKRFTRVKDEDYEHED